MNETVRERPVVLLVESPRSDRPGLAGRLDAAGFTVWQAQSGSDARQMLAEARRSRTEPDGMVSTADIAQAVWKCEPDDGVLSLIATQIARLRAKLRNRSSCAPSIVSVPGRGYRLLAA